MKKVILISLFIFLLIGCATFSIKPAHWCKCENPQVHCFYTQTDEICYCTLCGDYVSVKTWNYPNHEFER